MATGIALVSTRLTAGSRISGGKRDRTGALLSRTCVAASSMTTPSSNSTLLLLQRVREESRL
jgi:hypothetical protein